MKLKSGVIDQTAFVIEFYQGLYTGLDDDGIPYDGIYKQDIIVNNCEVVLNSILLRIKLFTIISCLYIPS